MPSLRTLRGKIKSVKSTQQITKAMKMMAAARMKKAQERILAARPFADRMHEMLEDVAAAVAGLPSEETHPLLSVRTTGPTAFVLVTADKGLCGAFNSNLIRKAYGELKPRDPNDVRLYAVGRKARDFFRRMGWTPAGEYVNIFNKLGYSHAELLGDDLIKAYVQDGAKEVVILYNEFKSVIQQRLVVRRLLPLVVEEERRAGASPAPTRRGTDFIYEPAREKLLPALLPRYLKSQIYRILLESYAAEMGARMTAMDSATKNAGELIGGLTLLANKIRQASITKELLEVVSGAEALA